MSETERWREPISALPTPEVVEARAREGWSPAAIEWERPAGARREDGGWKRPIPYGLRVSNDCRHLETDPTEKEVLALIVALIAGDQPLSTIAAQLNQRGFRTRADSPWTQVAVFQLLPRIVEFGPEILSDDEWSATKGRLLATVG